MNDSLSIFSENKCEICGKNYFTKYNDYNHNSSINCYENPEGYYLDINTSSYKSCYFSCKTCNIGGNEKEHNCIKCSENYYYEINISNYKNCYTTQNNSLSELMSDNSNIHYSNIITNNNINSSYSFGVITDIIDSSYSNYFSNNFINKTLSPKSIFDNIIQNLDITDINNGIDKKMKLNNCMVVFVSTINQKNNEDNYNITIDLGQCETKLKKNYSISDNDPLYILEIICEEEGMKIPKIEYEVYYPLYDNNNFTKLNLEICRNTKIDISIAVKINDSLDKYNSSSDYYNDICFRSTSSFGTDISLKDRRNQFIENNMTLCEENCELIEYNYTKEKAKCLCDIKLNISSSLDKIKFNKNDFLKNFIDLKNIANLAILKCYNIFLDIKGLIKNYGFLIISSIVLLYFFTLFIFIFKSFANLKNIIKLLITALILSRAGKKQEENLIKIPTKRNKKQNKKRKKIKRDKKINHETSKSPGLIKSMSTKNTNYFVELTLNFDNGTINNLNKKVSKTNINFTDLIKRKDFELNGLDYEEAIIIDKRSYFQYYVSLIKNNHPILFSFVPFNDYNSFIIKIFLFFFSFSLDLTINALFFNDDTMHKIYEDRGKFNFLYQIPQILYSTLISKIIDTLIKILALSQDNIINIKREENAKDLNKTYLNKIVSCLKIKFISFFIVVFMILTFFLYYITCFCGVYINTQIHLMKDSGFSLIISLLVPFGLFLIPGIFRISALRTEKPNRKYSYKFSAFLENLIG